MPTSITNYQCPNCNGPLHFSSEKQKTVCDFCGSEFTEAEITELFHEKNEEAVAVDQEKEQADHAETLQWTEEEAKHLRAYSCPSCGAELICDEHTAATACPYCGNPTVVPAQFTGALKPDYIIPFKLNKEQAVSRLKEFYKGKVLLPKAFSSENHIEEIKGIYVPYWLYDGDVAVDMSYRGTRSHVTRTAREEIHTTEQYLIERSGTVSFEMVPADASSKMPDELMDSIEPFEYADMIPFKMSYLPGYLADKYDVSIEENAKRSEKRMRNSAVDKISGTIGAYESMIPERQNVHIDPGRVHYAFMPVWLLSTQWNGNNYLFAMNGQTGKFVGDLPVDNGRFWMFFVLYAVIAFAVIFGLLMFVF